MRLSPASPRIFVAHVWGGSAGNDSQLNFEVAQPLGIVSRCFVPLVVTISG